MSGGAARHALDRVFDTPEQLAQHAADFVVARARQADARFAVCLSGGETPKRLYELLGEAPRRDLMPWPRIHWFWGDERVVPHDDPRSNFQMAWQGLLRRAPIAPDHIHAIPTEHVTAAQSAAAYEAELQRYYGAPTLQDGRPLFDIMLLGLGEDGHIASLFPGSPALGETARWAVAAIGQNPPERITLTYPALASSAVTMFLVVGARKRDALRRVRAGDPALPASRLAAHGEIVWFADRAAAGEE